MRLQNLGYKPKKSGRRFERQCKNKKRHASKEQADNAVAHAKKQGWGDGIESYWCEYCVCWHTGHMDKTSHGTTIKKTGEIMAGTILKVNGFPIMVLTNTPYYTESNIDQINNELEGRSR